MSDGQMINEEAGRDAPRRRGPWVQTLVLVGIAAVLGAYIFLVESKREPPPEPAEGVAATPAPMWAFEAGGVMSLTVARGEQTTTVERSGNGWRMTEPEESEADGARLDSLVTQVAGMQATRALADVGSLADFGLQAPEVQVTLVLTDGTSVDLSVGAENPRRTGRYVKKAGDPLVYLVYASSVDGLIGLLDQPPYVPTPVPTIGAIEVPTPTP